MMSARDDVLHFDGPRGRAGSEPIERPVFEVFCVVIVGVDRVLISPIAEQFQRAYW